MKNCSRRSPNYLLLTILGMGGGTGSGGAPAVAQISREAGYLLIGVVIYPFSFGGRKRSLQELHEVKRKNAALQMQQFVGEEKNDLLDYLRSLQPEKFSMHVEQSEDAVVPV